MSNKVFLTKVDNGEIYPAIKRLIDQLDLPKKIKKLGIKINLCDYRRRECGVTTDPFVLDPLLEILRGYYPEQDIYLFEHDATGTLADNLYEWLGLDKISNKYDIRFVNLARERWKSVNIDGYYFKEIEIPAVLAESTIINHPKLKTHGRTKITCGLKNMYACYRIKDKVKYHSFLDKAIADINLAIKCHYTIVDGYLCLEGNRGPTQGYPKKVGVFIGGSDIVAVDAFCAKFMGFNPKLVKHIRMSESKGIGSCNYLLESEIEKNETGKNTFQFNLAKYYLMELLRKVVKP